MNETDSTPSAVPPAASLPASAAHPASPFNLYDLAGIRNLDTVLGTFSFDDNRDPQHPSVPLIVKDGRYTLFQ